jgi:hypothetical protein
MAATPDPDPGAGAGAAGMGAGSADAPTGARDAAAVSPGTAPAAGAGTGAAVDANNGSGGDDSQPAFKIAALIVLAAGLLYCLLLAGLAGWSHHQPFKVDVANFSLFAAFIVVAGAIERFMEPLAAILPPFGNSAAEKADRALLMSSIGLIVGIAVSSVFGLYFLEAIGVKIGTQTGTGTGTLLLLNGDGDKLLRGFDIFITALIITGGTKQLHDLISSIEKKKESLAG